MQQLIQLNDTFCSHLLPESATSPSLDLFDFKDTLSRTLSLSISPTPKFTGESLEHLPIAARYASPSLSHSPQIPPPPPATSARMNAYNVLTLGAVGVPDPGRMRQFSSNTLNGVSRTHLSLPPASRSVSAQATSATRMSLSPASQPSKLLKSPDSSRKVSESSTSSFVPGQSPLPEDLDKVLHAVAGGILEGHIKLAAALRKRYEHQYPLVRSLADVFTSHVSDKHPGDF